MEADLPITTVSLLESLRRMTELLSLTPCLTESEIGAEQLVWNAFNGFVYWAELLFRSNPVFVYSGISGADRGKIESKMQGLLNPIHALKNNLFVIRMCIMMWDAAVWALKSREMQATPRGKPDVTAVSGSFAIHWTRARFHLRKLVMG